MKIMKAKVLLILIVTTAMLAVFGSCSDNDDESSFDIDRSEVFVMMGNKDNISILPFEGVYTVKSLDENIATGVIKKIDNKDGSTPRVSVSVTPVSKGKTTFIISNGFEEKNVAVVVVDPYIVFEVKKETLSAMVDADKSKAIMEELRSTHLLTMGNVFMLAKDKDNAMYLYEDEEDVVKGESYKLKGIYELVKEDKLYIVLKSGNRSFRFEIDGNSVGKSILNNFFDLNSMKSTNDNFLAQVYFQEDLTDEYNRKYQGGVSYVARDYVCTMLNPRVFLLPFE